MTEEKTARPHDRWAHLRFSIIGPLLAAPPARGELRREIERLSQRQWQHPISGEPTRFGFSTLERWLYQARAERSDPVGVLRRRVRKDVNHPRALNASVAEILKAQYQEHPSWSYKLHADNLAAVIDAAPELGKTPSYATVRRFLKARGFLKRKKKRPFGQVKAIGETFDRREVRSFEVEHVNGLWHLDFHHGSRKVLTASGEWKTPIALAILDDRSRLCCHAQWYFQESAENLIHGLCQAIQKRSLCRALLTDNGAAMLAKETTQGLLRLGIVHETTLAYSPNQNGKQEVFWAPLEGRLMAMLEGVSELGLPMLNQATQAWVELEYNKQVHSETAQAPYARYLAGPDVGRKSPTSDELRLAFRQEVERTQRRSDGTIMLEGVRMEIPARYRMIERVCLRYASWDLSVVHLADPKTGKVLCPIYPVDKIKNADRRRRTIDDAELPAPLAAKSGVAPLLKKLMNDYSASGLAPAYLPTVERAESDERMDG